jgi:hypothetical protein
MFLLAFVLLALLTAILRGGRLSRLAAIHIRGGWLIVAAFLLQVWLVYSPAGRSAGPSSLGAWVHMVSYVLLLSAAWLNRQLPGMRVIALGLLLNAFVISANGGFMPIEPWAVQRLGHAARVLDPHSGYRIAMAKDVVLPRELTRFWLLSDIFVVSLSFPLRTAFSIGDALLGVGIVVLLHRVTVSQVGPAPAAALPTA